MIKDDYVYENGVLKNKLDITDATKLNNAEAGIVFSKLITISDLKINKFDKETFKNIHKYIFEDLFDWAGKYRTVPIYKEEIVIPGLSLDYSEVKNIDKDLEKNINNLINANWNIEDKKKLAKQLAVLTAKVWKVHPFRDGNTRTTLTFIEAFAESKNISLNLGKLMDNLVRKRNESGTITQYSIRDKLVLAAIPDEYAPEPEHLARVLEKAISVDEKEKDRNEILKKVRNNFPENDYDER